jgi:NAD(P)-dependent dehydrogenase (short-subunit alcohol dehydrogenase family)
MIIVTGGSRGIGRAICQKSNGVSLSRTRPPDGKWIRCDVTDPYDVKRAFIEFQYRYGKPEALVNCAGIVEPQLIKDMDIDDWQHTINTNLNGSLYCIKEFLKYADTPIVNISSTAGMRPSPNWSGYSASKAGLINLSLTLQEELKPQKVYTLALGRCATELRRKIAPDEDQTKIMQPSEVADFVDYLIWEKPPLKGVIEVSRT